MDRVQANHLQTAISLVERISSNWNFSSKDVQILYKFTSWIYKLLVEEVTTF